jgi:hypothetical protein
MKTVQSLGFSVRRLAAHRVGGLHHFLPIYGDLVGSQSTSNGEGGAVELEGCA